MSSILTNTSAMVALQTLKGINANLGKTQEEISTGKSVVSAKDNSAVWAISKVMEADVNGFKSISDSLAVGESTVAVARKASETVTNLLTQMQGKIVAAQADTADRAKLQTDIAALRDQITSVVGTAQFNGLNLVNGSVTATNVNGNSGVNVLSSMDRDSAGNVTARSIGVDARNLSLTAGTDLVGGTGTGTITDAGTAGVIDKNDGGTNDSITLATFTFLDDAGAAAGTAALAANAAGVDNLVTDGLVAGDEVSLRIGAKEGRYTIKEGDSADSIVTGMKTALQANGLDANAFSFDLSTSGELTITNNTNQDVAFEFGATRGSGGLASLATLDVSTAGGAQAALASIENLMQTSINAAASFGSSEKRINIQNTFVSSMVDSLRTGIGAMVDADMEEASARLQALQVQQQLAVQSLSIANQAPQSILSLFR